MGPRPFKKIVVCTKYYSGGRRNDIHDVDQKFMQP